MLARHSTCGEIYATNKSGDMALSGGRLAAARVKNDALLMVRERCCHHIRSV